jgi:hypothetical protein
LYFGRGYTQDRVDEHAQEAYRTVMKKSYSEEFQVLTEGLAALVASPAAGGFVRAETVAAANVALWQVGVFNQLVQQQTETGNRRQSSSGRRWSASALPAAPKQPRARHEF